MKTRADFLHQLHANRQKEVMKNNFEPFPWSTLAIFFMFFLALNLLDDDKLDDHGIIGKELWYYGSS